MGQFAEQFKDYQQFSDSECYRKSLPANATSVLALVLLSSCDLDGSGASVKTLECVANDLLAVAGKKQTTNWNAGALRAEIKAAFKILQESSFDRFMDATLNAFQTIYGVSPATRHNVLSNLNAALLTINIGYTVRAVGTSRLVWEARNEATAGISSLAAAAEAMEDVSQEALEHLQQATTHLATPSKQRSRKDALRDAMSAMEAMVKKLAHESDFDDACKKLRAEKVWGNDQIVKDGLSTWGLLHHNYPDIRHGQPTETDIDLEEATYWIERITAYVRYMAARKRVLGR